MMDALKLIIEADPGASVGSRFLLTTLEKPTPECADFLEIAWLYDIGYRRMMLCDSLCLREEPLARSVSIFNAFKLSYGNQFFPRS
jgi:hypothetical protein